VGNLAQIAQSDAVASGGEFRYRMAEPITLGAHSSALVPFTQVSLTAEAMTRFQWTDSEGRLSVKLANASGQTLPGGPLAVYASSGLAGEGTLARLASGRAAWLGYGNDLDVSFEHASPIADTSRTKLVRFEDQRRLVQHYVRHREQPIHLVNHSSLDRTVCIELPLVRNASVHGADRLAYDAASNLPLAIFEVKARSELDRTLGFDEGLRRSTEIGRLTRDQLVELANEKELEPGERPILLEAAEFMARNPELADQRERRQEDLRRLAEERARIEQTVDKLKGASGNAAAPLVRRLMELDARRTRLEADDKASSEAELKRRPQLAAILERLNAVNSSAKTAH
jgi:hypothetical protein